MTLQSTLASIATAAVLTLETLVAAAAPLPRVSDSALRAYRGMQMRQFEDPDAHLGFLKKNEFVVPDYVFDLYRRLRGSPTEVSGIFLNEAGFEQGEEFQRRMRNMSYDDGDIHTYFTIFNRRRTIIVKESELKKPHFRTLMLHERVHKAMPDLMRHELHELHEAYQAIKEMLPASYFKDLAAVDSDPWREFYPVLAEKTEFDPAVETKLKNDHPEAYAIFSKMVEPMRKELL
jgi:hypothetical protein